jgi:hypothetical protein
MKKLQKIVLISLLLAPLIWFVGPFKTHRFTDKNTGQDSIPFKSGAPESPAMRRSAGGVGARPARPSRPVAQAASAPEVDEILASGDISNEVAASRLLDFASDRTRPTSQRLEALTHGLNLDINVFAIFGAEQDLPAELASHLLSEFINCNQSPDLQIRVYMNLSHHPDVEVSEQAREMLAFRVADGLEHPDLSVLLEMGEKKLDELRRNTARTR